VTNVTSDEAVAIAEVMAAEAERCRAIEESDQAALDLLLGEELINTHSSGSSEDKATHLNRLSTPGSDTYTRANLSVRIYGDVAVMRGDMDVLHSSAPPTLVTALQLWTKRDGRWQLIAFQNAPRKSS
jgi:hypothetical protein